MITSRTKFTCLASSGISSLHAIAHVCFTVPCCVQAAAEWLTDQEDIAAGEQVWLRKKQHSVDQMVAHTHSAAAHDNASKKAMISKYAYVHCEENPGQRKRGAALPPAPQEPKPSSEAKAQVCTMHL